MGALGIGWQGRVESGVRAVEGMATLELSPELAHGGCMLAAERERERGGRSRGGAMKEQPVWCGHVDAKEARQSYAWIGSVGGAGWRCYGIGARWTDSRHGNDGAP